MNPLISVIIPSYNYAHFLPNAIESVLSQSFRDFELIIIDDASQDESIQIAKTYTARDKRIKLFRRAKNEGIASTMNEGVKISQGKYISGLSADDQFLPGFLEKNATFFRAYPEIGICCSDFGYFFESLGKLETRKLLSTAQNLQVFDKNQILKVFRKTLFWIPGHTAMFRRDAFFKHGGYLAKFGSRMDWFLYHRIALFEGAGYLPETLTAMRFHSHSLSSSQNQNEMLHNLLSFFLDNENRSVTAKFKKSALLNFLFKPLLKECLLQPATWSFYPPLIVKFIRNRLRE